MSEVKVSSSEAAIQAVELTPEANAEFKRLIEQTSTNIQPIIDQGAAETQEMVQTLVDVLLKGKAVKGGLSTRIETAIGSLTKLLSDQVNAIMHHPDFRTLEGAWRGLDYLVKKKPPGQHLQLKVMNISKKELGDILEAYSAESGQKGWTQSLIFRQVFNERFDMPGGNPFGCLVGDYQFDKSAGDIDLLKRMSAVCGAAHSPFITAASPKLVGLKSWQELPDPAELADKMAVPDLASWRSLREMNDSRYLALTLPRMLARLPYGKGKKESDGFHFEEDLRPVRGASWAAGETKHDSYVWSNSAYAMAANIADTFHRTCFCTAIRGVDSGGKVEGLPIDSFPTDDGGVDSKCPTEVAISQRREAELGNLGFMPLSHWQNTDFAAFVGAQTVQKPQKYDSEVATANAELSARLPYVFLVSRFAHYLKKMIYEWVGTNKERAQLEKELNEWIMMYSSAPTAAENVKREKPLAEAKIEVKEVEGKPGYYEAFAYLRPHIQLEGVSVNLGVVSKLPGGA